MFYRTHFFHPPNEFPDCRYRSMSASERAESPWNVLHQNDNASIRRAWINAFLRRALGVVPAHEGVGWSRPAAALAHLATIWATLREADAKSHSWDPRTNLLNLICNPLFSTLLKGLVSRCSAPIPQLGTDLMRLINGWNWRRLLNVPEIGDVLSSTEVHPGPLGLPADELVEKAGVVELELKGPALTYRGLLVRRLVASDFIVLTGPSGMHLRLSVARLDPGASKVIGLAYSGDEPRRIEKGQAAVLYRSDRRDERALLYVLPRASATVRRRRRRRTT